MVIENNQLKFAGEFKVIKPLANNSFVNVYMVEDVNTHQYFALKAIKKPNNKYQVNNEIHILKIIKEVPHVLRLYKVFHDEKKLFFVYELAHNGSLKDYIKDNGVLSETQAIKVLKNVLATLKGAHELGIIHNDIRVDNIYVNEGYYSLANWSHAKQKESIKTLTTYENKYYYAPEFYQGFSLKASDIYALGATLFYLVTGKEIFDFSLEDSHSYIMYANCKLNVDLSMITSDRIKYLILIMLHKDYKKRATLEQVEGILEEEEFFLKVNTKHDSHCEYKEKNDKELYSLLANENIAFAQDSLGLLYEFDLSEHDIAKAFALYEKASKQGFISASYHLAKCYEAVFENEKEAFYYYKKAAIFNHPEAIFKLAHYYEKGIATKQDLKKAIQLYFEAANHGNLKAYKKLSKLESF